MEPPLLSSVTLDLRLLTGLSAADQFEPGGSEIDAISEMAELSRLGAIVTRVYERNEEGYVEFGYLITVEQAIRRDLAYANPFFAIAEDLWHRGYRGEIEEHLNNLWRERWGEDLLARELRIDGDRRAPGRLGRDDYEQVPASPAAGDQLRGCRET
jgi:hypothetical protein